MSGDLAAAVADRLARLDADDAVRRIWDRDVSVWADDPGTPELADRLGWLDLPAAMPARLAEIEGFAADTRGAWDRVVLCGMGGSSLAPEVLWRTFGPRDGFPRLVLLDSTHPDAVRDATSQAPPERTLFVVASKSGTTIETASFEEYCWGLTGGDGSRFIAITDPDTALERRARERGYRHVFLSPPDVGGRFAALAPFGLVPAALIGVDVGALLADAARAADACRVPASANAAARLGVLMAEGARLGRDKLTLLLGGRLASFGLWVEQLVAESTGKAGTGVLPVVGEAPDDLRGDERDRVYVVRGLGTDDRMLRGAAERLAAVAPPVDADWLRSPVALGGEFFRWEFATAVAGAVLRVNPFDQPNVAESKTNTQRVLRGEAVEVTTDAPGAVRPWLAAVAPGDYVSVMAYVPPTPDSDARLAALRRAVARRTGSAVTVGYGPRFLHSTGQLHKGGPPRGHFLQVVAPGGEPLPIPGAAYGFGELVAAQADGDWQALRARGRPVLRVADWAGLEREVGA